ncbi:glycosyltransferase [Candidatus Nitrospira neomarina]|uniref:Glycosyltransferase n=1 Tax=Candidatus Nitrospira neomarina TaxID=3020899 RepID=A0AA96GMN2_9BACT|nr:glycosyltransferase [Candidatus Nitrospira neomarina]WNM63983.1 glycosyltransferase [Candidatus Nitrospira neomarina]
MNTDGAKRLRVLFFSQRFPLPMDTGGKIRTGKMLEGLKKHFDITLLCHFESPKDEPYLGQVKKLCDDFQYVLWKEVFKYSFSFYARVLAWNFSRYPISVKNDYSRAIEGKIAELVQNREFDLLICDFLQPTLNFRNVMGFPTLLFQHNVESMIVKRHFQTARNAFMKMFWWAQWKKMERFEKKMCQQFNAVVAVSEQDKLILQKDFGVPNVHAIPTGVDLIYFSADEKNPQGNSLVFVGAMDWLPNEDAIVFFARNILPRIRVAIPDVTLTVVGRNPSAYLRRTVEEYPEIRIVGRVEDVRPYIRQKSVYIIPLRIGGGTRIKVYEAMAMGKAIVSTRVGTEGLPVEHGKHVLLADQPQEFAKCVIRLLQDPIVRNEIGRSAREFVETRCGWNEAVKRFSEICLRVYDEMH